MLTSKENPPFPARIHRNPAKFTGTKRRKTSALPRILDPALCSNRFELLPRPRKHALRIGKRPLHTALHIHGIKLCRSLSNDVRQQQAPLVRRLRPKHGLEIGTLALGMDYRARDRFAASPWPVLRRSDADGETTTCSRSSDP